ncbi:hypothetical protein AB5I41_18955 [Sphingomonas sp. MMS24-JH45]
MTAPTDHSYFDLARGWADERDAAGARSRRIAWTVAGVACSVAALEAVALALAMPLKDGGADRRPGRSHHRLRRARRPRPAAFAARERGVAAIAAVAIRPVAR